MSAQPNPIMQPETLRVLQPMYNEDVAITNLMIVLVSERVSVFFFLCVDLLTARRGNGGDPRYNLLCNRISELGCLGLL